MIRAIVIGEGQGGLENLKEYATSVPGLELVASFDNPEKGLHFIEQDPSIRLVFQEVGKPRLNGIPLANKLPSHIPRVIISNRPDDAQAAFELNAADYLLWPFSKERFQRALQKARMLIDYSLDKMKPSTAPKKLPAQDDIIMVKVDTRMVKLRLHEITHIRGDGNYVTIFTTKGKWLVYHTMKRLEDMLSAYQFIRVHKSYIVSFQHIDTIEKHMLHVKGEEIPISDSYKDSFLQFISDNSWQI
jgi:DNA-binding LytR/AlgR family response regulator